MNRRSFMRLLGLGSAVSAAVTVLPRSAPCPPIDRGVGAIPFKHTDTTFCVSSVKYEQYSCFDEMYRNYRAVEDEGYFAQLARRGNIRSDSIIRWKVPNLT